MQNYTKCMLSSTLGKVTYNVLRLKNVAKMQHQAFTNITKTLNLKNMFQDTS